MNLNFARDKVYDIYKKKRIVLMGLVALLLAVGAIGFVSAKYISSYQQKAEIHASNFHFSSNYLKYNSVPEYNVSDWGNHAVNFLLYNYEVENVALISETSIQYSINVPAGWSVSVSDASGTAISADNGVYTMAASATASSHSVTLTYTGTGNPGSVTVTAASSSPYKKEIKAKFNLSTKKNIEYSVEDKGNYDIVTISTNNYSGKVDITWTDTHAPDNTSDYMANWVNGKSGTFDAAEYTTYTLIFFENTAGNYDKNSFTVSEGGGN